MQSDAAKQAIGGLMQQGMSQQAATQAVLAKASEPLVALGKGLADANANLGSGSTAVEVDTQNLSMIFGFSANKKL